MNRISGISVFLFSYLFLFVLSIAVNVLFINDLFIDQPNTTYWLYSISQVTLTHFSSGHLLIYDSNAIALFSLTMTQLSGLLLYSMLLWMCWQLFGSVKERSYNIYKALKFTSIVTIACEGALFMFFLYGIPEELTGNDISNKIIGALTLSVNSFNNAGFTHWSFFFEGGVLENNFMMQVGIIGGTILGSLSVFVLTDLFSPFKLRERLNHPEIDWSFTTKVSVFGTAIILLGFIAVFILFHRDLLIDKNVLESLSLLLMEGVGARGFGFEIVNYSDTLLPAIKSTVSLFGSGSFSTGGGVGLLVFVFLFALIKSKNQVGIHAFTAYRITLIWMTISAVILAVLSSVAIISGTDVSALEIIDVFSTNHMSINAIESSISAAIKTIANIAGRLSFIIACLIAIKQTRNASGSF